MSHIEHEIEKFNARVLEHYTSEQQEAALQIYDVVRRHFSTGGGNAAAGLLLGLYNGHRFPYDLTNLRRLDAHNQRAAFIVLQTDATNTWCEIHVLLDAIRGTGSNTGAEFECWAYDLGMKRRCTKEGYVEMCLRAKESRAAG